MPHARPGAAAEARRACTRFALIRRRALPGAMAPAIAAARPFAFGDPIRPDAQTAALIFAFATHLAGLHAAPRRPPIALQWIKALPCAPHALLTLVLMPCGAVFSDPG